MWRIVYTFLHGRSAKVWGDKRRLHAAGLLLALMVIGAAGTSNDAGASKHVRQRGVSWVAGSESSPEQLAILADNNVDWIVQTPFGWQATFNEPQLALVTGDRVYWGERDVGLRTTARNAAELGIDTLLKPHIWLMARDGGKWRNDIAMGNEEDWKIWFENYRIFILHYAKLAQETGMGALCIGTELYGTVQREQEWRHLIAAVREVYDGRLTYAANWYREYEDVAFWDALDFIGIQAYFPLSKEPSPSVELLVDAWSSHTRRIEAISRKYSRPVVFTELGYRSTANAASEPWRWPEESEAPVVSLDTQVACYEAFFRVFWSRTWFEGAYIWKWFPEHSRVGGENDTDFTPQNKPAQAVIAKWFAR